MRARTQARMHASSHLLLSADGKQQYVYRTFSRDLALVLVPPVLLRTCVGTSSLILIYLR